MYKNKISSILYKKKTKITTRFISTLQINNKTKKIPKICDIFLFYFIFSSLSLSLSLPFFSTSLHSINNNIEIRNN